MFGKYFLKRFVIHLTNFDLKHSPNIGSDVWENVFAKHLKSQIFGTILLWRIYGF